MPPKHRVVAAAVAAGDSAGGLAPRVDQNRPSPSPEKRAKAGQTGGGKDTKEEKQER